MNKRNLRRLIDHLKLVPPEDFNMAKWGYSSNQACIAGHAYRRFRDELDPSITYIPSAAQKWLGLDERKAHNLFHGGWSSQPLNSITLEETIDHLESLADA